MNNSSEEENVQKDPYSLSVQPLKLRVKIETPPEPDQTAEETKDLLGGSSMFERILKSISGDQEETEEPHKAAREEMLRAVEEESGSDSSDSSDSSSEDSDSEEDSVPQVILLSTLWMTNNVFLSCQWRERTACRASTPASSCWS